MLRARDGNCSAINAGEVYYQLLRRQGQAAAESFWRDLAREQLPVRLYSATDRRVHEAASLKAVFPISYADAFAVALSSELRQPLVTGDAEIENIASAAGIEVDWLG